MRIEHVAGSAGAAAVRRPTATSGKSSGTMRMMTYS